LSILLHIIAVVSAHCAAYVWRPKEQHAALSEAQRLRVSRVALSSSDLRALVNTAVNLHSRALEQHTDRRW
jgi:hypothetical protein